MDRRVAPSAALEAAIAEMLTEGAGVGDEVERVGEIGRLGARLVLQRAIEEEVTAFLGRARYERVAEARGSRNGNRSRQVQTAEGELEVRVPQVRGAAERFVSRVDLAETARSGPLTPEAIGRVASRYDSTPSGEPAPDHAASAWSRPDSEKTITSARTSPNANEIACTVARVGRLRLRNVSLSVPSSTCARLASSVRSWELDRARPRKAAAKRLARFLGVKVEDLGLDAPIAPPVSPPSPANTSTKKDKTLTDDGRPVLVAAIVPHPIEGRRCRHFSTSWCRTGPSRHLTPPFQGGSRGPPTRS